MVTNTFAPHVGGVARAVEAFSRECERRGHHVLVIAPEFEGFEQGQAGVVRVPAVQNFNGSDFSVVLATPPHVARAVDAFGPDIVHSHHPFLLGATALRLARSRHVPLVFTHHTLYERYTHYVPGDSTALRRFVMLLSSNYANLSDAVFAPSESVAALLRERQVTAPIHVVPSGVDLAPFERGCGAGLRRMFGIPEEVFVAGHVGRLAREKNLDFLAEVLLRFLGRRADARVLIVGEGPKRADLEQRFAAAGLGDRVVFTGTLQAELLVDAYKAMDVFAFSSHSETQGLVLVEAMAAGLPVVAVDASGVREVVRDGDNGRLLGRDDEAAFADALAEVADMDRNAYSRLGCEARATAEAFSLEGVAARALGVYETVTARQRLQQSRDDDGRSMACYLHAEFDWVRATMGAASRALRVRNAVPLAGDAGAGPEDPALLTPAEVGGPH